MTRTFVIITGEFPPVLGGVSDYSHQVAAALARRGDRVHVFTPRCEGRGDCAEVRVHELPDKFGVSSIAMLDDLLDQLPAPREILLQYVPHAFGMQAMNLPLCLWLLARSRRREQRITVVFHEVSYPISAGQSLAHNALGVVNHGMAAMLARAADRAIVTIPASEKQLRMLGARCRIDVAAVPSNLPLAVNAKTRETLRTRVAKNGEQLIGTFGSYNAPVVELLDEIIPRIVAQHPNRKLLLIGRNSDAYLKRFGDHAHIAATGSLDHQQTAAAIAACDLLVQPYPDGVSGRRGSTAAALGLGVPVITNLGRLSEDFWRESRAVVLAAEPSVSQIIAEVDRALDNPAALNSIGAAGRRLYQSRFALEHTIALLSAGEGATA